MVHLLKLVCWNNGQDNETTVIYYVALRLVKIQMSGSSNVKLCEFYALLVEIKL